jgi:molecular chaperone IbpA
MTSKQLRVTSDFFNSPLYKMSVGFDKVFDSFFDNVSVNASGYPPYNVAKILDKATDTEQYEITLAIAGFTEEDLEIIVENGLLKITGKSGVLSHVEDDLTEVTYIYKGIAERNFSRTFKLAEHVEVQSAQLKDGILRIRLYRNVPDAVKPKMISINS